MNKETGTGNFSSMLRPVATQRASEAIYEQIRELIVSGQLKPGDRLPSERSMMQSLQRSRPTIREALRMLERAGLIRTMPGTNGAIVQQLGTDEVEQSLETVLQTSQVTLSELAEYRIHNDTAIARWAAMRHDQNDIEELEQVLKDSECFLQQGDYASFLKLDASFHGKLAKAAKNEVAHIITQVMSSMARPKMFASYEQQNGEENQAMCSRILSMHRRILEAVRQRDEAAAEIAMSYHIQAFNSDLHD